jgi:sec-independent protein translocase protein TatB
MFSLGWMEISIILIITIVIVGPKEIPTVIKFIKKLTSNLRNVSKEFSSTIDEITHIQEVKDIKKEILETKEAVIKEGKGS